MATKSDENLWGPVRSTLKEFTFSEIKSIVGFGNLEMSRLAHLEQKQKDSASKSQLLSAIDEQVGAMDGDGCKKFISICCEEMVRRKHDVKKELDRIFSRLGWTLSGNDLIPIDIFDSAELVELPQTAHEDIQKAARRLRDGDLSGALSAACGALDAVTSEIYDRCNLGDPTKEPSFQDRIKKSMKALKVNEKLIKELDEIGWPKSDIKKLSNNIEGSLNQAAFVMQSLRSSMGDVHGTKPVITALVYDSIKWSSILLRVLAVR